MEKTVHAFKGFDGGLSCRGHSFEIGRTYCHDGKVVACRSGFHACEHPLAVFDYYPPATSRYAAVELAGEMVSEGDKIAAARITVHAEIDLSELTKAAARYVIDRVKWVKGTVARRDGQGARVEGDRSAATATGEQGAATATGEQGAATATGWRSAATATGDESAATATSGLSAATATGWRSAATATGWRSAATATGDESAATATGDESAATATSGLSAATATGWRSAATATGWRSAATATGVRSAATATGWWSAATATGYWSAATATGENGVAIASGPNGRARGAIGCDLVLREFRDGKVVARWIGTVGQGGIKPDTWYRLVDGRPTEVA